MKADSRGPGVVVAPPVFDENAAAYITCGCCHARGGVMVFGVLAVMWYCFSIGVTIYREQKISADCWKCDTKDYKYWGTISVAVVYIVLAFLSMVGAGQRKHLMVFPYIIALGIQLGLYIIAFIIIIAIAGGLLLNPVVLLVIGILAVAFAVAAWHLALAIKCYNYCRDYAAHKAATETGAFYVLNQPHATFAPATVATAPPPYPAEQPPV